MIYIHYDFTNGTELSYIEGIDKGDNFNTSCLDFFTTEHPTDDVIVIDKNGNTLSRNRLLNEYGAYTEKEIRKSHNIQKMLKANSFNWRFIK
jgi:hypothetical protein